MLRETYKRRIKFLAGIIESKEIENIDSKTSLKIFDFDGTLVDTELPEEGKLIWKEKTGKEWKGGWFSNPDSLNMDVFDMETIPSVISDYKKFISDQRNLVIMLTGRILQLKNEVKAVLDSKGLKFDDYLFNEGGDTENEKIRHMEMILKYNPNIRDLEIFDDRDKHIEIFKKWGKEMIEQGYLDNFKVNHIPSFRH